MQLCLLHLDDALLSQPDFIRACDTSGARQIALQEDARAIRLWGSHAKLAAFQHKMLHSLGTTTAPRLTFMGSGDFHHVTALLLDSALAHQDEQVTLIHFDNHPDWVKFGKGTHCGSWVGRAHAHAKVAKIITIGACSHDLRLPEWKGANLDLLSHGKLELYPYDHAPSRVGKQYGKNASYTQKKDKLYWQTIRAQGEQNFVEYVLSRINTASVYLTIDKDVLAREDAITNWDQGCMRLPYLLTLIREIGKRHRIVGADVTGDYSRPSYSGNLATKMLKHAEIFLDQPRGAPEAKSTANINSAANHALLEVCAEAMA